MSTVITASPAAKAENGILRRLRFQSAAEATLVAAAAFHLLRPSQAAFTCAESNPIIGEKY
jgi:hypothetical protein